MASRQRALKLIENNDGKWYHGFGNGMTTALTVTMLDFKRRGKLKLRFLKMGTRLGGFMLAASLFAATAFSGVDMVLADDGDGNGNPLFIIKNPSAVASAFLLLPPIGLTNSK